METVIAMRGTIYEQGYGLIAQKVMRDKNLSIKAKGIYAYLSSFAGSGMDRTAFPGVELMMHELGIASRGTFYKYRNELIEAGYISVEQHKNNKGRYTRCVYYIEAVKKDIQPCTKNQTTDNKTTENVTTNNISFKSINNKNNKIDNKLNLNLNPEEILLNAQIPSRLKIRIKVLLQNKTINLTPEQILLIEDAYIYQIRKGYIKPDCAHDDITALNDYEFSATIEKMLMTVKKINNMQGLIKKWIQTAYDYKCNEQYVGDFTNSNSSLPFYNWLDK